MIIVAASPSADWTAAELKENENQEDGSKGESKIKGITPCATCKVTPYQPGVASEAKLPLEQAAPQSHRVSGAETDSA